MNDEGRRRDIRPATAVRLPVGDLDVRSYGTIAATEFEPEPQTSLPTFQ